MEPSWSLHLLSEILSAFSTDDPENLRNVVNRVAESVDAEVAAMISLDGITSGIGLAAEERICLEVLASSRPSTVTIAAGTLHTYWAPLRGSDTLVVGRLDAPFDLEERSLLRAMARSIELCLFMLDAISAEREARCDLLSSQRLLDERLAQLKESEERLLRVMQGTNDGWWDWDLQTNMCFLSQRWIEMMGGDKAKESLHQGFWFDRIRPSQRDDFERKLRQTLSSQDAPSFEQETELLCDDGAWLPVLVRGTASRDEGGCAIRFSGTILDISDRKKSEKEVHKLAYYDALTNLYNRRGLLDEIGLSVARCQADHNRLAVLMIDLDRFKKLNDTRGHAAGDQMLQVVAKRLKNGVRSRDTVARLGGDEFVVLLNALSSDLTAAQLSAERVARSLLARLNRPYELESGPSNHTASIGVAVLDEYSTNTDELMQHADVALYDAKAGGRAMVRLFDPEMKLAVTQRAVLEQRLRGAIDHQELKLFYQGIVDQDRKLCGAEALIRWPRSGKSWIAPDQFIPVAEESGLIHQLGSWGLRQVAGLISQWQGRMCDSFRFSLNLSATQFLHPDFLAHTLDQLDQFNIGGQWLKFEITEETVLDDLSKAAERMNKLRDRGIEFALDDFGKGYSSLSYLRQLPFSDVKIDKSYIANFLTNRNDAAILKAILSLCKTMGISLVAEGIETEEQWQQLRLDGCDRFQGFMFSVPREPGRDPESLLN